MEKKKTPETDSSREDGDFIEKVVNSSEQQDIAEPVDDYSVSIAFEGLTDEQDNVRSAWSLKVDPPVMVIADSSGQEVRFIVTKDVAFELAHKTKLVRDAFYNIDTKTSDRFGFGLSDKDLRTKRQAVVDWFFRHRVFVISAVAFIAVLAVISRMSF